MKINKLKFGATIPVMQYGNIMPEIEIEGVELKEGTEIAMGYIKELFQKYSEKGALSEKTVNATVMLKSWNEEGVEVEFDPIEHVFTYKGQKLTSATTFTKKLYKEFNLDGIAKATAKSWEVDEQALKDCWKSNGDLTSDMGKVIHSALEHYDKNKKMGEVIKAKKELDGNYALPKHPLLLSIIKGFIEVDKVEGEVVNEILLTDVNNGYCGLADRVKITGEKKCRIQDYKVNIESEKIDKNLKPAEPFDKLPYSKLSKYQIQMSFYANMLQKAGWTVEGLDAYVYEDSWKHFPLEVLNVITKEETTT